ncbi:preprotein translocase subunit SecE [Holzapfeliella floricola]|uniref:preprotein translocase subunit SecE n=1 Tax=Holzapfeliella floricola TaxID=679249 RepID=UPI000704D773|nr:preprotein translocase subunit SecE [Holzapfeliella floricola]
MMKFLKSVFAEMKLVSWPTLKENRHDTWVVISTTVMFAVYLGLLDWAFGSLMTSIF